jgi:hypothetical protein
LLPTDWMLCFHQALLHRPQPRLPRNAILALAPGSGCLMNDPPPSVLCPCFVLGSESPPLTPLGTRTVQSSGQLASQGPPRRGFSAHWWRTFCFPPLSSPARGSLGSWSALLSGLGRAVHPRRPLPPSRRRRCRSPVLTAVLTGCSTKAMRVTRAGSNSAHRVIGSSRHVVVEVQLTSPSGSERRFRLLHQVHESYTHARPRALDPERRHACKSRAHACAQTRSQSRAHAHDPQHERRLAHNPEHNKHARGAGDLGYLGRTHAQGGAGGVGWCVRVCMCAPVCVCVCALVCVGS